MREVTGGPPGPSPRMEQRSTRDAPLSVDRELASVILEVLRAVLVEIGKLHGPSSARSEGRTPTLPSPRGRPGPLFM